MNADDDAVDFSNAAASADDGADSMQFLLLDTDFAALYVPVAVVLIGVSVAVELLEVNGIFFVVLPLTCFLSFVG